MDSSSNIRVPSLIAIFICAILWFFAPFIAINILTLGDQPTALQFITDDIFYIGELTESPAFWAAVFSLGGIIMCFICDIIKKPVVSRIIAVLAEIPMVWAMVNAFRWADGDMEDFFDMFGMGFWGIFLLFLVVILVRGERVNANQETPAAESLVQSSVESPEQPLAEPPEQNLYCGNCGTEIKPGIKFCAKCGSPISQEQHKS